MPLIIYGDNAVPTCRAVLMLADHLELKVHWKEISLHKGEHMKPEFVKLNPLHSVPVLDDHGTIIINSHAIMQYLGSKYGNDTIYPHSRRKRAAVDEKLFFDASYVFPSFRSYVKDVRKNEQANIERHVGRISEVFDFMQMFLSKTKYISGDHLTIADFSLVSSVSSLEVIVPIDEQKYPDIKRWLNDCHESEVFEKMNRAGVERIKAYMGQMFAYFYV